MFFDDFFSQPRRGYAQPRYPQRGYYQDPYFVDEDDYMVQRQREQALRRRQEQERLALQRLVEEEQRRKQYEQEQLRRRREEIERKKREKALRRRLAYISRPDVQEKAATIIQKTWRGVSLRKNNILPRLSALNKVEDEVFAIEEKYKPIFDEIKSKLENVTLEEGEEIEIPDLEVKSAHKTLLSYEEEMMRKLFSLDAISSGTSSFVRNRRKQIVTHINDILSSLDIYKKILGKKVAYIKAREEEKRIKEEEEERRKEEERKRKEEKEKEEETMEVAKPEESIKEEVEEISEEKSEEDSQEAMIEDITGNVEQLQTTETETLPDKIEEPTLVNMEGEKSQESENVEVAPTATIEESEDMPLPPMEESTPQTTEISSPMPIESEDYQLQVEELKKIIQQKDEYIQKLEAELSHFRKHQETEQNKSLESGWTDM